MSSIIFHIDVNSAYLSWTAVEKLKNGSEIDLRKIPSDLGLFWQNQSLQKNME